MHEKKADTGKKQALVFGITGAIGEAVACRLAGQYRITAVVRKQPAATPDYIEHIIESNFSERSLQEIKTALVDQHCLFDLIVNAIGVLHNDVVRPEKRLADLNTDHLHAYFQANSITPALLIKHFYSLMPKQTEAVFATLSAKVGSITDNYLGAGMATERRKLH